MAEQGWTATGVIEAPLARVAEVYLNVSEGPVSTDNAPLLHVIPGAGRFLRGATLRGGPTTFAVHYGEHPGGTVEVDTAAHYFAFQGGFKFRAEYRFSTHPKGTLLTCRAINVAPASHRERRAVRLQFWLGGKLQVGLRGGLRRIARTLGCRAYPGS